MALLRVVLPALALLAVFLPAGAHNTVNRAAEHAKAAGKRSPKRLGLLTDRSVRRFYEQRRALQRQMLSEAKSRHGIVGASEKLAALSFKTEVRAAREHSLLLQSKARADPPLQPSEVYDKDYPVDWAKLTPEELRYKAQADYANAIAKMKKEAAESEAAQQEMENSLKSYQNAEQAARNAKKEAEDALKNKQRYMDEAAHADAKSSKEAADTAGAQASVEKEKADLAAADKAYQDAVAGKAEAQAKIDAMKKKHEEICSQIKALEAELASMGVKLTSHKTEASNKQTSVSSAQSRLDGAAAAAAAEAKEAEAALKRAEEAKAKLANAEHLATGAEADKGKLQAAIDTQKQEYDAAAERFRKEDADVQAAQKRVDRARAELAKYEHSPLSFSGSTQASSAFAAALAAIVASLAL